MTKSRPENGNSNNSKINSENLSKPETLNLIELKKKDINSILKFMKTDKKNTSSKINLLLIKGIGKTLLNYSFSQDRLKKFFKEELVN